MDPSDFSSLLPAHDAPQEEACDDADDDTEDSIHILSMDLGRDTNDFVGTLNDAEGAEMDDFIQSSCRSVVEGVCFSRWGWRKTTGESSFDSILRSTTSLREVGLL